MSADLSNELAALLRVLEKVERASPISTLRRLAELQDEAKSESADPTASADQSANRIVERIETAMMKLRAKGGQS